MALGGQMHAHRDSAWVCVHARVAEVNAGPVLGVLSMACAGKLLRCCEFLDRPHVCSSAEVQDAVQ